PKEEQPITSLALRAKKPLAPSGSSLAIRISHHQAFQSRAIFCAKAVSKAREYSTPPVGNWMGPLADTSTKTEGPTDGLGLLLVSPVKSLNKSRRSLATIIRSDLPIKLKEI